MTRFRELAADRCGDFVARGVPARSFFPHRLYYLPKYGPDALRLGRRMCGEDRADRHWELLLHADSAIAARFPASLFHDDEIIWHRQQYGLTGHVAFAYLVVSNGRLYGLNYVSDLVQRISRRRELKTQVEKVFQGWHHLVLNGMLNFAVEQGLDKIYSPTAAFVMAMTDPTRTVQAELFERVYDRAVTQQWIATREGRWWVIDVAVNRDRLIVPSTSTERSPDGRTICISHDIERGLGHLGIDADRAALAERLAPNALTEGLAREAVAGATATYNVVGQIFDEVRTPIERGGHCLAFHSYSHRIRRLWPVTRHYHRLRRALSSRTGRPIDASHHDQLYRCRLVDRRVRGFRPPQSRPNAEWSDANLAFRNFDWLATSDRVLGVSHPVLEHGLVKIPIQFDDFPLYRARQPYEAWERQAVSRIEASDFTVLGLHDCYADFWLPEYGSLLKKLADLGEFRTLDEVADATLLKRAA